MNKPFDPTKPVQTRGGKAARILATGLDSVDGPIAAAVACSNRGEYVAQFYSTGRYTEDYDSSDDLVNVPEKKIIEFWLNVYPYIEAQKHTTRRSADDMASENRLACLHFKQEFEEGEGL